MVKSSKWTNVKLLSSLVEEIKKTIKDRPELGYNSVSDFVKDSVRRRLEELNQKNDL